MPFNYNFPTRVCERAAMLDIMSGGRLDLGAGRGGMPQELALCNVDAARTTTMEHLWEEYVAARSRRKAG